MDYKRRITEVAIEGLGKVRLKSLSAGFWQRVADIGGLTESEGAQRIRISAEAIASSWVDEQGKPVLASAGEALDELELDLFNAISREILNAYGPKPPEEAAKNSGSVQV